VSAGAAYEAWVPDLLKPWISKPSRYCGASFKAVEPDSNFYLTDSGPEAEHEGLIFMLDNMAT
jgi:hypothetical protein